MVPPQPSSKFQWEFDIVVKSKEGVLAVLLLDDKVGVGGQK